MELWIRSQNKGILMKVEKLGKIDGTIKAYLPNSTLPLGTYENDERALEVLDEIQNILETRNDIKQMVYEMPKD